MTLEVVGDPHLPVSVPHPAQGLCHTVHADAVGVRRLWPRIAIAPVRVLHSLITERRLRGDLWDLFGFAEYVLGRRPGRAHTPAGPSPEGSDL